MSSSLPISSIAKRPPSENTVEVNVTSEILSAWSSPGTDVTAISPPRNDEDDFGYDMLPDPGPSNPVTPQLAVAIQFKSLMRTDDDYISGGIGSYDSGEYLKVKIDNDQLDDIRKRKGVSYGPKELFYAIPLPATRLRGSHYLPWTMFIDAFDLPSDTTRIYIPPYYCPGAFSKELDPSDIKKVASHNNITPMTLLKEFHLRRELDSIWEENRFPIEDWTDLDDFAKKIYDISDPLKASTTSYEDRRPDDTSFASGSPIPQTYGVYAGSGGEDPELITPDIVSWTEIQRGLNAGHPGYGRGITPTVTPDGGESGEIPSDQNILIPPDGWTLFVATRYEE